MSARMHELVPSQKQYHRILSCFLSVYQLVMHILPTCLESSKTLSTKLKGRSLGARQSTSRPYHKQLGAILQGSRYGEKKT